MYSNPDSFKIRNNNEGRNTISYAVLRRIVSTTPMNDSCESPKNKRGNLHAFYKIERKQCWFISTSIVGNSFKIMGLMNEYLSSDNKAKTNSVVIKNISISFIIFYGAKSYYWCIKKKKRNFALRKISEEIFEKKRSHPIQHHRRRNEEPMWWLL